MKGKIILKNKEEDICTYDIIKDDIDGYDYIITIRTDLEKPFTEVISDYHALDKAIDNNINNYKTDDEEYEEETFKFYEEYKEEQIEFYEECKKNTIKLLQEAEFIEFEHVTDEIIDYINRNPILKTKKIIIGEEIKLNTKKLDRIKEKLDNVDNLYFKLSNNTSLISFNECYNTCIIIDKIVDEIKKFNFSPFETIMYVYDLVRNRLYKEESRNEDLKTSRDLTQVLLGDKIVCLGYSRIFSEILNRLGIKAENYHLIFFDGGIIKWHARNRVYVKDEKYGIDGVYDFDVTGDRKRKEDDNTYLLSYKYFAKTKLEMTEIDGKKYTDNDFRYFSKNMVYKFMDILEQEGFEKIPEEMFKSINYMSLFINDTFLINPLCLNKNTTFYGKIDKEKVIEGLEELVEYFDTPIYADTLLKVLYNVRKIQYYIDPVKYPFDIEDFYKTLIISKWNFEPNPTEKFYQAILGLKPARPTKEQIEEFIEKEQLEKNIAKVKLTRALRTIHNRNKKM